MTEGLALNALCELGFCFLQTLLFAAIYVPLCSGLLWLLLVKAVFECGLRKPRNPSSRYKLKAKHDPANPEEAEPFDLWATICTIFMGALMVVALATIAIYSFRFEVSCLVTARVH